MLKAEYTENRKCQKILTKIEEDEKYYAEYNLDKISLIQKSSLLYISNIIKLKKNTLHMIHNILLMSYFNI